MTTNQTTPDERENVTEAQITNYSGEPGDGGPATFAQLQTGRFSQETVFGDGAEATVRLEDGELRLTLRVSEFDDPGDLLERDILSVVLCGKDIPQEGDE